MVDTAAAAHCSDRDPDTCFSTQEKLAPEVRMVSSIANAAKDFR
jgi:hypothetical protein